jgi:multiple sugar transport system substrate-binding protein
MTKTFNAADTGGAFLQTRNISRRGLLGGALGAAAAVGLSACGAGSAGAPGQAQSAPGSGGAEKYEGPNVSLAYWNGLTGGDGPIMKKLMEQFNKEHPNIKVSMTAIAWADYYQKLPAAVSNGKGPDVGIMHEYNIATNAARQVIQPLDDIAKALDLKAEDFSESVWPAGMYQDKRYAIPLDIHPGGLFYNKKVMEKIGADPTKPPTTGDEMMAILDQAKSKGVQGLWVSALTGHEGPQITTLIYQYGGTMVNPDGRTVGWGEEAGVKAVNWYKNLIDQGYSPKNAGGGGNYEAFDNDKSVFMTNGPWMTTPLSANKKLQWGAAPMPKIGDQLATWSGTHHFVIPRQVKPDQNKAQAARVFVNWMSQQSLGWADAGMVPARRTVREDPGFADKGAVTEFAKMIDYVKFVPPIPGVNDIAPEFQSAVSTALLGKQPVEQAMAEGAAKANKILEANIKKYQG